MKTPLHPTNWSKLNIQHGDYKSFLAQRRNILFSRFCITGLLAALLQGAHDLITGFPMVMLLDIILGSLLLVGYLLNERRHHKTAKILVFLGIMALLFAFAAVVPRGVGIYLLYFPLVAFSFIALDYKDRHISYFLALLALIFNAILLFTNYQPFGKINLQPIDPASSFAINLFISITLIVLGIDFLLKINKQAEEKLLENQLQTEELASEVNKKNFSLQKTNEELDRFVYSTSHDLRSPLASIMGLINLTEMSKEPIPAEVKEYIHLIKDRVNNLDGFIQDIIDYSRNSRVDLVLNSTDIKKMIDEVILNNSYLENSPKVKIITEIDISRQVLLDSTRMARILNNLVSNAIKYNDLNKAEPAVTIKAYEAEEFLEIEISDTGKGIRPEIQSKIFDMFFRGNDSTSGSGLGLYITREMVQKMNGSITFNSTPAQGTTFHLSLPLHINEPEVDNITE